MSALDYTIIGAVAGIAGFAFSHIAFPRRRVIRRRRRRR